MAETKKDAPIPAEDAESARPWRLPFWTEPPVHKVEREPEEETAEGQESSAADQTAASFPTAEELEAIRRDAYNDGLEQGLIEGRQQGKKEGYDAGFAEGQTEGREQGYAAGHKEGATAGFAEGKANGEEEVSDEARRLRQINTTLQATLKERDEQLPEVMVMLLTRLAEQVLQHELSSGAASISRYVDAALASLPSGEKVAKILVADADLALLKEHQAAAYIEVDSQLDSGECRVESENTLVEYSVSDDLQQSLLSLADQLLTASNGYPDAASSETDLLDLPEDVTAGMVENNDVIESSDDTELPDNESESPEQVDDESLNESSDDQSHDQSETAPSLSEEESGDDPEQPLA